MRTILATVALLWAAAVPMAGQPVNPAVDDDPFFVAGDGVGRYPRNGDAGWRVLEGVPASAPARVAGGVLVVSAGRLLLLDPDDGGIRWARQVAGDAFAPVAADGRVFLATREGRLMAFSLADGAPLWSVRPGRGWLYPPARQPGLLVTGGQDGVVWALDPADGRVRWQVTLEQELVWAPLALGRGRLLVTTFSGDVAVLEGDRGRRLWSRRLPAPVLRAARSGGALALVGMDGVVLGVDPESGATRWRYDSGTRLRPRIASAGGRLLLVTDDGVLLVLDGAAGHLLGRYRPAGEVVAATLDGERVAFFTRRRNEAGAAPVLVYVDRP